MSNFPGLLGILGNLLRLLPFHWVAEPLYHSLTIGIKLLDGLKMPGGFWKNSFIDYSTCFKFPHPHKIYFPSHDTTGHKKGTATKSLDQ
jgi:hypothetical protein